MAINSFLTGLTFSLYYDFRDSAGSLTSVATPVVNVYTPQKELYLNQAALATTATTGRYQLDFYAAPGLTIGHWISLGIGITQSATLFSDRQVFEIVDVKTEPAWLSLTELRTYLNLEDTDHSTDTNLKQALQAAIELVEGYCHTNFGEHRVDEVIEIRSTDRIKLNKFPVISIVAMTPTARTFPRSHITPIIETFDGSQVDFHFRLDYTNGILELLDSAGYDMVYDGILLGIAYTAGFATVPEPVRQAALSLAAQLNAISCSEGIESVNFSGMSMRPDKNLFDGHIKELLLPYRNIFKV